MNMKNTKLKTDRLKPLRRLVERNERSAKARNSKWDLRLYIAGQNPKTITAINNLKLICEDQLKGKYKIKVIDLHKKPSIAHDDQIIAIPTLVRKSPLPVKKLIGDLSKTERVLVGLDLLNESVIQRM